MNRKNYLFSKIKRIFSSVIFLLIVLLFLNSATTDSVSYTVVERISVSTSGTQANAPSSLSDINADGRYVVFASTASNLVDGDTNAVKDVFLRDRQALTTVRVSVTSGGGQVNGDSDAPVISADGRYIAYSSYATNLVTGDTNAKSDIFLYDTVDATTIRISVKDDGTQADDHSFNPSISSLGGYVAYESQATNLITGDTNGVRDIFVYNRVGVTTTRVSVDTSEVAGNNTSIRPAISEDGRYVTFSSIATNLITTDTNAVSDVFLRDRTNTTTIRVSVSSSGVEANGGSFFPTIDDDGSNIAYESVATNLITGDANSKRDIFVYNTQTGETTLASSATAGTQGNNDSGDGVDQRSVNISGNGEYIAFKSRATNLVSNDTNNVVDVFVNHQRTSFVTNRISISNTGTEGDSYSYYPAINEDGRYVSFYSYATNLVTDDTNGFGDIFVYDRDALTATPTFTPTPTSSPTPTSTPIPTATPTPTGATNPAIVGIPQSNTPVEIEVNTTAGIAKIRCEKVTTGGTVSIQVLTSPPGQIISGMTILRTNFDVTASGLVCDIITVCLPYSKAEVTTSLLTESVLKLYHYKDSWSDITSYLDTTNTRVCGKPNGFSPMVIGSATNLPTNTPTSTTTPAKLPDTGSILGTQWFSLLSILIITVGVLIIL